MTHREGKLDTINNIKVNLYNAIVSNNSTTGKIVENGIIDGYC